MQILDNLPAAIVYYVLLELVILDGGIHLYSRHAVHPYRYEEQEDKPFRPKTGVSADSSEQSIAARTSKRHRVG